MSRSPAPSSVERERYPRYRPFNPPELSPDLQEWLDAQPLSRIPTMNKAKALDYVRNNLKIPATTKNSIKVAFDSGAIKTALLYGTALASEYEIVKWTLSSFGVERPHREQRNRAKSA